MDRKLVEARTILEVVTGSQAYGTATKESDIDVRGICIADNSVYHGLHNFEQLELHTPDLTIFEIKKFCRLAMQCNPNILELLFIDKNIRKLHPIGEELRANRDMFVSLKAKHTYTGYAVSQIKKLESKHKHITSPPKKKPERQDYIKPFSKEWVKGDEYNILPEGVLWFDRDAYKKAMQNWANYQRWLKERNPARRELEEKYFMDTKFGMHCVRLMRMGYEIITGQGVIVERPDAEELLSIRNGAWSYEKIVSYADEMLEKIDSAYDKEMESVNPIIPKMVAVEKVNELCMLLIEKGLKAFN